MRIAASLLCLCLLNLAHAQSITRRHNPFKGLIAREFANIQLIRKEVEITFPFKLAGLQSVWKQVPDMKIEFFLKQAQFVKVNTT